MLMLENVLKKHVIVKTALTLIVPNCKAQFRGNTSHRESSLSFDAQRYQKEKRNIQERKKIGQTGEM